MYLSSPAERGCIGSRYIFIDALIAGVLFPKGIELLTLLERVSLAFALGLDSGERFLVSGSW